MKTGTYEMTLNELEQVTGGGVVQRAAKRKLKKLILGWISSLFDDDEPVQGPNIGTDYLTDHLKNKETN